VKFTFIHVEKALYPLIVLCSVLGVSRSGYYAWWCRPVSRRARADANLKIEITATHRRSRQTYGSPRIHRDLKARGVLVGKKRVERLMREQGLVAKRRRRFRKTTDSNHAHPIAPNVLDRRFDAELPEHGVGDRRDVHLDARRLALPRGDSRPLLASRSRLGDE
jgi:putative transposase